MLVAIDIGNSSTVIGLLTDGGLLVKKLRVVTNKNQSSEHYYTLLHDFLNDTSVDCCTVPIKDSVSVFIISSVVPSINDALISCIAHKLGKKYLLVAHDNHNLCMECVDEPREVGADLICNAMGALSEYNSDCIIVDFGTATTFLAIQQKKRIVLCAVIAPGIYSGLKGLIQSASLLQEVEIHEPRNSIIQTNTVGAIQAGLCYGAIGMAEGIVKRLKKAVGFSPKVIVTGGFSPLIKRLVTDDDSFIDIVDIDLTLKGLYQVYLWNKDKS